MTDSEKRVALTAIVECAMRFIKSIRDQDVDMHVIKLSEITQVLSHLYSEAELDTLCLAFQITCEHTEKAPCPGCLREGVTQALGRLSTVREVVQH